MATQVRTLVDSIGHSLKQLPEEAQRHPRLAREVRNAFSLSLLDLSTLTQASLVMRGCGGRVREQVQALEKLVNATVNAMRAPSAPAVKP